MTPDPLAEERAQLRRLRFAMAVEGATLLLLLFVAVPAKHLLGIAEATRLMGPVHGVTFLFYSWTLLATVSGGGWRRAEIARLVLAALLPFGAFANRGLLRRREMALQPAAGGAS